MKAVKLIGIVVSVLLVLALIITVAEYIYFPERHESQVKTGIAQEQLPAGIIKETVSGEIYSKKIPPNTWQIIRS